MTEKSSRGYWGRREAHQRALAEAAASPLVREIHLRLADRQADKAWSDEEAELDQAQLHCRRGPSRQASSLADISDSERLAMG